MRILAALALSLAASAALAQPPPPPGAPPAVRDLGRTAELAGPPKELLPQRVGGTVVYVRDLEAQRRWYETMLGFRVQTPYARDGQIFEYIMNTGDAGGGFMGLMKNEARPNGMNTNSRVVLPVPDPRALANFFSSKGVYVREAVAGSAYIILDPEGNQIELYRLATPAPAAANAVPPN